MEDDDNGRNAAATLIHGARDRLGWSLQRAADAIGDELGESLSPNSVWKWEKGTSRPDFEKVPAIERALRIPRDALLNRLVADRVGLEAHHIQPHSRREDVLADNLVILTRDEHHAAGYDARIAKLPEHVRRTIDGIIEAHEAETP